MPISAVVTFCGFPGVPPCHLALTDQGYPAAVAGGFAAACRASGSPASFLRRFAAIHRLAQPVPGFPADHHLAPGGAEYHYRVRLVARRTTPLLVDCWRRYPGGIGWQRRCGPMALERFLDRFQPQSAAAAFPVA